MSAAPSPSTRAPPSAVRKTFTPSHLFLRVALRTAGSDREKGDAPRVSQEQVRQLIARAVQDMFGVAGDAAVPFVVLAWDEAERSGIVSSPYKSSVALRAAIAMVTSLDPAPSSASSNSASANPGRAIALCVTDTAAHLASLASDSRAWAETI